MHCVVTGAAGFIGSSIVDRLLAEGHSVVGIDCFIEYYPRAVKFENLKNALQNSQFQLREENLLQADLISLLQGCDWVFHQAAQAGVRASWGQYFNTYTDNNVLATQRLLEAVRKVPSIKKVVYASSSSVYGNAESFPTSESVIPQPVSPYGVTKLAAEHLMSLYASQFNCPTISLRYFTVYGPRQRPEMAFHRLIRCALEGQEFELFGTGEQTRDFTFVQDIVEANLLAARSSKSGQVYNIGGGTQASMNQVLEMVEANVGKLKVRRSAVQPGDAKHTSADTTRARSELNYLPRVTLQNGIQAQVNWLREVVQMERRQLAVGN